MILVVGSTGLLGSEICRRLVAAGKPVRAMARPTSDPVKVQHLKDLGAAVVQGDLRDPGSLHAACQGVDTVITTVSAMPFSYQPGVNDIQLVDDQGESCLIDAAKSAGVRHFIYTSFSKNFDLDFPLSVAKRSVEARLMEGGMTYTILRPSAFMEVWLSPAVGFDVPNGKVQVYGTGDQPISWIALGDVAAFAVASVDHPAARNAVIEMGGPEQVSPHQAIAIFEFESGRTFELVHVPVEALQAQLQAATDPMQKSFVGLMLGMAAGDPIPMAETAKTFGIDLTPVEEFARRSAAQAA